jgi:hypothetical protein
MGTEKPHGSVKGIYIVMMTEIAPETAHAQTASVAITAYPRGTKRPKLMKMAVGHDTKTTSKGNVQ